jgi:hypothetical protein
MIVLAEGREVVAQVKRCVLPCLTVKVGGHQWLSAWPGYLQPSLTELLYQL